MQQYITSLEEHCILTERLLPFIYCILLGALNDFKSGFKFTDLCDIPHY